MNEQERQIRAQEIYQTALQVIAQEVGMTIEPSLQLDVVSSAFATSRAVLILKPLANWQPLAAPQEAIVNHSVQIAEPN